MPAVSIALIIGGLIYLIKPEILTLGFWKKATASKSNEDPSPINSRAYQRVIGIIFILWGIYLAWKSGK